MKIFNLKTKSVFRLDDSDENNIEIVNGVVNRAEAFIDKGFKGIGTETDIPENATKPPKFLLGESSKRGGMAVVKCGEANTAFVPLKGDLTPLHPAPTTETTEEDEERGQVGRLPKLEKFWDSLQASGKSAGTIQGYRYDLKWWENIAGKNTVYSLRIDDIEHALKGSHPCTARRKIACLKSLSRFYLRNGKTRLHTEILKFTSPKLPLRIPGDLGAVKFRELRKKAKGLCKKNERAGLWLGLMVMAGLRISEIQTATIHDEIFIKVRGKANKERIIPAPRWIHGAMERIPRTGGNGWERQRNVIYKEIKGRFECKPHSLRHTYASELLRRGKNIEEVKELLGHADIGTTTIYARVSVSGDVALLLDRE